MECSELAEMSALDKLTKAEGASQASDDSDSIFGVSAELKQNWREGVPLALQLQTQHSERSRKESMHAS